MAELSSSQTESDIALVAQSTAGNRDAFGRIVERYQSMVCAVAFSATGNLGRSEDLAQETFVTAWRRIASLREPEKLRSWLRGIARNTINDELRRRQREPVSRAESLDASAELAGSEPLPIERAISNEEVELLWREVALLPDTYREPLVLFYREHRSVARVAETLELSEEAVLQRLSRGRKQIHDRMLAFVEEALEQSGPGPLLSLNIQAALPALGIASQAGGLSVAKGAIAKSGGGALAVMSAVALPFIGMFAALGVSFWVTTRSRDNHQAKRFNLLWNTLLWVLIGIFLLVVREISSIADQTKWTLQAAINAYTVAWMLYLALLAGLLVAMYRRTLALSRRPDAAGDTGLLDKVPLGILIANYVAPTAWMIGFAWLLSDHAGAVLILLGTIALAGWNLHRRRHLSAAESHRLGIQCNAALCLGLLFMANLRLHYWLMVLFNVSFAEMEVVLPKNTIHLLTVALLCWSAILWWAIPRRWFGRSARFEV